MEVVFTNYKPSAGQKVKVKELHNLENEFKKDNKGGFDCIYYFHPEMIRYCGMEFEVENTYCPVTVKRFIDEEDNTWHITYDMVKLVRI